MIVKMEKVTILISAKGHPESLKALRKIGVVHIKNLQMPQSQELTSLEEKLIPLNQALMIISGYESLTPARKKEEIPSCIQEIIFLQKEKKELLKDLAAYEGDLDWFKTWGDISLSHLDELEEAGVYLKLYLCAKRDLKKLGEDKIIQVIKEEGRRLYLAQINREKEEKLALTSVQIPERDLAEVKEAIRQKDEQLTLINARMKELAALKEAFLQYKRQLTKKIEFFRAQYGMKQEEGFCYLEGFCPKESLSQLKKLSLNKSWGYISQEPDDPTEVPTLIRNPQWVKIIKPVFSFMGALPGYNEFDISFWFLLFFSLFFAMIIGDAGYGLVFFLITYLARRKFKKAPREPFILVYVLSVATIIWGAITGSWFGFEKIAQLPLLNILVIDRVNSFIATNQLFMIHLCFIIGAIHLSVAHAIIIGRFLNSLVALAHLGWIAIIWGVYFIATKFVLDHPISSLAKAALILGMVLVVLFSCPQKKFFKGILISLANLPLKVIGSFSDVISYLRLFAVGSATLSVAITFNNLALGTSLNPIAKGLIAALILFFGHTLNILLGLLSVVVHGIRLNMLEFAGHLNMEWSGKEYAPFKE